MLVDKLAGSMGMDPYFFRMKYLRLDRAKAVLKDVYDRSGWATYNHVGNRRLGRALGLTVHQEAKSFTAAVVEIDTSDTAKCVLGKGAKVIKAWIAVDVGMPINVSGLKAQFEGGLAESISLVLDAGLNFVDGLPQEFAYHNDRIARMNTYPKTVDINVFKANGQPTGGAGEVGMSATSGVIGNAWRRATGINPRNFPLNGKSCTCLVDGVKQTTCSMSVKTAAGKEIITIEGLGKTVQGASNNGADKYGTPLHVVQPVWIEMDVAQCGFCQPGQIMAAIDLLRKVGNIPTDAQIDQHMDNVCRCGTYDRIRKPIMGAGKRLGTQRA